MVINCTLSRNSIQNAIKEVEAYKRSLDDKCRTLCDRLYQLGITVAQSNTGQYGPYIVFSKKINDVENGIEEILVMSNTGLLHVEWLTKGDEIHSADVSPILMAEFGSGWNTDPRGAAFGIVQGSLNTYGHAFESQWHYKDFNGNWHTSKGEKPLLPLYKAEQEMINQIGAIALEVFKT